MRTLSLAFVLTLLAGSTATADHKEWNRYFAGSWTFEDGSGTMDLKVAADGHAAVGIGRSTSGEESVWVMGWDPAKKVVIHEWFGAEHGRAVYELVDDKTLRGTGAFSSTTETTKGKVTLTKKDDRTYTVVWTDVVMNGEKSNDISIVVKKK